MKTLCFVLMLSFGVSINLQAGDFPPVKVNKINDRVYAMTGDWGIPNKDNGGFINNILVVIGDKGIILVDGCSHQAIAAHVDKEIKKISKKPITHIFATHFHTDHHLGASYFKDAKVIATEYTAKKIQENPKGIVKDMARRTGHPLTNDYPVIPHEQLKQNIRKKMTIHGVPFEMITPATAHTQGDLLVYLPEDQMLASGDVMVHKVNPNSHDGNLKSWLTVLADIRKLPIKVAMPGHGALMKPADIGEFETFMTDFYNAVLTTFNEGGDMSDVRKRVNLDAWKKKARYELMIGRNISAVWLQVEAENF